MKSDIKKVIFSFGMVILIIIVGLYIKKYLSKTTTNLLTDLLRIEASIDNNSWDDAENIISGLDEKWEKTEGTWALFTNHHEIDNIAITLKKTDEFIKSKDRSNALAAMSELKHYISHIPEMEKVTLRNIF